MLLLKARPYTKPARTMNAKPIISSIATLLLLPLAGSAQDPAADLPPASDDELRFEAAADSHVYAYDYKKWNESNWGAYEVLSAGSTASGGDKRIYLKFAIPADFDPAAIGVARLRLYHYAIAGEPSVALGVHQVTDEWVEGTGTYPASSDVLARPGELTWMAQPAFNEEPAAVFKPGDEVNKFVEVDVTDLVHAWLKGANNGLVIAPVGDLPVGETRSGYSFFAREKKEVDKRPVILIDRISVPPPPTDPDPDPDTPPEPDPPTDPDTPPDPDTPSDPPMTDRSLADLSLEEKQALKEKSYEAYIADYNKLTSLMAAGKGGTPEAEAAYAKYAKAKADYETLLEKLGPLPIPGDTGDDDIPRGADPVPDPGDEDVPLGPKTGAATPADVKEAYAQYMAAYNKLTYLMQRGQEDTPAAKAAYKEYERTKAIYEAMKKEQGDTPSPSPDPKTRGADPDTPPMKDDDPPAKDDPPVKDDPPASPDEFKASLEAAYKEYIASYEKMTELLAKGQVGTPEAKAADVAYEKAKAAYESLLAKRPPAEE